MKTQVLTALFVLGLSTQAFAATKVYDCGGTSDPDHSDVAVYEQGGKFFAFIQNYYGDGDDYAEDFIQVKKVDIDNADVDTFVQIPGKYPRNKIAKKATNKSEGVTIRISQVKGGAQTLTGLAGPNGDGMSEDLDCKKLN